MLLVQPSKCYRVNNLTAVRGMTLVYEALKSIWFKSFFEWCRSFDHLNEISEEVWSTLLKCHDNFTLDPSFSAQCVSDVESLFNSQLVPLTKEFRLWGCKVSPTFKYWDMFLQAVEILLQNIRAERDGLWSLHLKTVYEMLPYFFVTNKNNYSRWTPAYTFDMLELPSEIQDNFEVGSFSIRQKSGCFNGVCSDMAT